MMRPLPSLAIAVIAQDGEPVGRWTDVLNGLNTFYRKVLFLPEQASTVARKIDELHYLQITVMFAVGGVIAVAVMYFIARYHRRRTPASIDLLDDLNGLQQEHAVAKPTPRIVAPIGFEVSVYAGLFGLFVFFWVLGFRQFVELLVPPAGALDVYVTGKQWVWQFAYPKGPATAGVLYVPAGKPIRLLLTSRDVIHSFFVPDFRIKRDAVPGLYTEAWFEAPTPGTYNVLCTELCGVGHSVMRAGVVVLRPQEFEDWLDDRPPVVVPDSARALPYIEKPTALMPLSLLAERGRTVAAQKGCLRCHSVDGSTDDGPTWLHLFGEWELLADGQRVFVDQSYITRSMMEPGRQIVAGFPNIMPSFMGLVSPAEASAIIAYMRALSAAPVERQRAAPRDGRRADTTAQVQDTLPRELRP